MRRPALFDACPVPGCRCTVADGRVPCGCCLAAFGPMLRQGTGQAPDRAAFAAAQAARLDEVLALLRARRLADRRQARR